MKWTRPFWAGSVLFVALVSAANLALGEGVLTFDDVQKARPVDIRKPFSELTQDELVIVLDESLHDTTFRTAGCNLEWEWRLDEQAPLPYKTLTTRVDSRRINFGGGEVQKGRLLYHPESRNKDFAVVAPDGKTLLTDSWHTLAMRDAVAGTYWSAVGAFHVLAERVAKACAENSDSHTPNKGKTATRAQAQAAEAFGRRNWDESKYQQSYADYERARDLYKAIGDEKAAAIMEKDAQMSRDAASRRY